MRKLDKQIAAAVTGLLVVCGLAVADNGISGYDSAKVSASVATVEYTLGPSLTTQDVFLSRSSAGTLRVGATTGAADGSLNAQDILAGVAGSGEISCPGAGTNSEQLGAGATTGAWNSSTSVGTGATCNDTGSIAIGHGIIAGKAGGGANPAVVIGGAGPYSEAVAILGTVGGASGQAIGYLSTAATQGVAVGGSSDVGNFGVAVGHTTDANAQSSTALGGSSSANFDYSIALGSAVNTTAANQCLIGGGNPITSFYVGKGVTSAAPSATVLWTTTGGSGADTAATDLYLAGGKGTGAGSPGDVVIQTATTAGSSSTLQTLATVATFNEIGVNVVTQVQTPELHGTAEKALTDGVAVALVTFNLADGEICGGTVTATIHCTNGTDHQSLTTEVHFAAVRKASTVTADVASASTLEAKAVSGGTLVTAGGTNGWTTTTTSSSVTILLDADTSLTPSDFHAHFTVFNNHDCETVYP